MGAGVTAHLPLFIIPAGSPPLPSDISGSSSPPGNLLLLPRRSLRSRNSHRSSLSLQAHCACLSALKGLMRGSGIARTFNREQRLHSVSAPDPPVLQTQQEHAVSLEGQRQFILCTSQRKGTASETLHTTFALLTKKISSRFQRPLVSKVASQLQPSHVEGLNIVFAIRGFLLMPRTSLWTEVNFHPPILWSAHCASHEDIYKHKFPSMSLGHELGQVL